MVNSPLTNVLITQNGENVICLTNSARKLAFTRKIEIGSLVCKIINSNGLKNSI